MSNTIDILILANSLSYTLIQECLRDEPDLRIRLATETPSTLMSFLSESMNITDQTLVLVDDSPVYDFSMLANFFKNKDIPFIVIVDSVKNGFQSLEQGASDMLVRNMDSNELYFYRLLAVHIRNVLEKRQQSSRQRNTQSPNAEPVNTIIAIGSSTGGTETVLEILKKMPLNIPPILLVQHMPPVFTKMFAERLNAVCDIDVWEAQDGDLLANGRVLIAPGDYHMTLAKNNRDYYVECKKGSKIWGQCPSVDVLFESVARVAKAKTVGVILTGMGSDGAEGLLRMYEQGAYTIGQDEKTSVVYGMPRAAYEMGAVKKQLPIDLIPQEILKHI